MAESVDYSKLVNALIERQLTGWDVAKKNYGALSRCRLRSLRVGQSSIVLQFNPERIRSSAAKVDAASLKARKCFLCSENQPVEQEKIVWNGKYKIQLNPYPIFPLHLTISELRHTAQRIEGRMGHMLDLAHDLPDFVLFYNGPKCGASAPDHMHFQAGNKGFMPYCDEVLGSKLSVIDNNAYGSLALSQGLGRLSFLITATTASRAQQLYDALYRAMPTKEGDPEPMHNILCWWQQGRYYIAVFPRRKHRPACYGSGEGQFLLSPASVDMGGVWAVPVEKDFNALTAGDVQSMLDELCMTTDDAINIIQRLK